jgi:hypothetical protein
MAIASGVVLRKERITREREMDIPSPILCFLLCDFSGSFLGVTQESDENGKGTTANAIIYHFYLREEFYRDITQAPLSPSNA